ncbi:MAG: MerR family transcriptional regulator [Bacteroidales bacterium]|jgi:DNA-binding transcriptional MerR regulator|nr:MerR family transcriptional regulator [Bacteroidales bacterium]
MNEGKLYYNISEVAEMLGVNTSLLRYWETEFPELRPAKNKKGTRSYTQKDIDLLRRIHYLTKECGLTLDGARQQLKSDKSPDRNLQLVETLTEIKNFLIQMKQNI